MTKPLLCLLALLLASCTATPPSSLEAAAAQVKSRGFEIIIIKDGRTHYFQNLLPRCLAYSIVGEWDFATQELALQTPDRRHFVGVTLWAAEAIPDPPGEAGKGFDALTRAIAYIQADSEKDFAQAIPITVAPFPAALPGAVLLKFGKVVLTPEAAARALGPIRPKSSEVVGLPDRVLIAFPPGFVMVLTADEADARQVLGSLEVTDHPRCWEPTIHDRFPGALKGKTGQSYIPLVPPPLKK